MQSIIKGILFTVLLGFFTVAVAEQLSPGARIDKHMVKAELLRKAGKYQEALKVMKDSVLTLTEKDSLKLPDDFHFKYARVALSADSFGVAKDSAKRYIKETETEKGQPYDDALTLLNEAERQDEIMSIRSHSRFWRVAMIWGRNLSSWTWNTAKNYYTEIGFFVLIAVLFFFFARRLISKIIAIFKDRKALSIIIPAAIGIASLVLPAGYHTYYAANYSTKNVFEERITNRHTQIDTLALKGIQQDIMVLLKGEDRIMDSLKVSEARLDSTIKTLQDSVSALQDSVNKHPDRHLHIIEAKLDTLRDLYKVTRE